MAGKWAAIGVAACRPGSWGSRPWASARTSSPVCSVPLWQDTHFFTRFSTVTDVLPSLRTAFAAGQFSAVGFSYGTGDAEASSSSSSEDEEEEEEEEENGEEGVDGAEAEEDRRDEFAFERYGGALQVWGRAPV